MGMTNVQIDEARRLMNLLYILTKNATRRNYHMIGRARKRMGKALDKEERGPR